jgi:CheY-like chemotaxis protein
MSLPLFYYPTTFLMVDDEKIFQDALISQFSKERGIKSFQDANKCVDFLKHYKSVLCNKDFLYAASEDEKDDLLHSNGVTINLNALMTLLNNPKRYEDISVAILDYHMPQMDGLTLAKHFPKESIQKILLTGNATESDTIKGFNDGLINRFVQKGQEDTFKKLSRYVQDLERRYFEEHSKALLAYLEVPHKLPASDPVFIDFFESFIEDNDIIYSND